MADARIRFDEAALADLARHPAVRQAVLDAANKQVPGIRGRAPKRTGEGAASIHAVSVLDHGEETARISWARENYYLGFHELGTRTLPARPFLVGD
jgi:HK97 gp10 family phage protein